MKNITDEDLIDEIELMRDSARGELQDMHQAKMSQNSFGAGYETGTMQTCQRILDLINGVAE